jgi:hypothetical protein
MDKERVTIEEFSVPTEVPLCYINKMCIFCTSHKGKSRIRARIYLIELCPEEILERQSSTLKPKVEHDVDMFFKKRVKKEKEKEVQNQEKIAIPRINETNDIEK